MSTSNESPNTSHRSAPDEDAGSPTLSVMVIVRPRTPIPSEVPPFAQLTREEFLARHGADPNDLETVTGCAKACGGIEVSAIDAARRMVLLRGPGAAFSRLFEIEIHAQASPQPHYGARYDFTGVPQLPAKFRGVVEHVIGLPEKVVSPLMVTMRPSQDQTTSLGDANGYGTPGNAARLKLGTLDALEAYYRFPRGTGAAQTVGIIELGGGYRSADVQEFFAACGIESPVALHDVLVRFPGSPATPCNSQLAGSGLEALRQFALWMQGKAPLNEFAKPFFEATMDVSIIGALLPEADIQVYFGDSEMHAFAYLLQEALFVHEPQPSILSISWSFQERWVQQYPSDIAAARLVNDLFLAAAHMGVTICCSSGDWGASNRASKGLRGLGFDVNFPASSPYALACGGTTITADGAERVWNADFPNDVDDRDARHGVTGGGYSRIFEQPPWQVGVIDADRPRDGAAGMRGLPDVAAVADPHCGVDCRLAGERFPTAGTSAAAPIWAALVGRLNENLGHRVGCLGPQLYAHAGRLDGALNDVTAGDNRFDRDDVGFDAHPGWDPCTGLGTPNGEGLLDFLRTLLPPS